MRLFHDTWLVFRRSLGLTVRQPAWLIAGVMQPFVYLILFGPLLDSLSSVPGFPSGGAFNTFVPGLLVMTALFGSTFVGFGFISEMRSGVVERLRVTPMSRTAAVLGRTLRDVVVFIFQGLVLVVVSIPLSTSGLPHCALNSARMASTEWYSGLSEATVRSHSGANDIGSITPDRRRSGSAIAWVSGASASSLPITSAIA